MNNWEVSADQRSIFLPELKSFIEQAEAREDKEERIELNLTGRYKSLSSLDFIRRIRL